MAAALGAVTGMTHIKSSQQLRVYEGDLEMTVMCIASSNMNTPLIV